MNKLLLFTAISLISFGSFAQLNVVETAPKEEIGKVKNLFDTALEATKRGDQVTILYRDLKFKQIKEFKSFTLNEQAFQELYDLLMQTWENPPEDDIMIELDEGYLWLDFTTMMGITSVRFMHSVDQNAEVLGFSQWMTKRQVDKLFGNRS